MSEEIALAVADLALTAQLRARVLEWKDAYERLAGAFDLHLDILECNHALADLAGVVYDVTLGAQADRADQLEQALAVAMRENDGWRALAGTLQQRNAHAERVVQAVRAYRQAVTELNGISAAEQALLSALAAYEAQHTGDDDGNHRT